MKLRNALLFAAATIALGGCGKGSPNIKVYSRADGGGTIITLENQETQAVQLERLVLNGRENDPACSVNLFRALGPGARTEIPVPACGEPVRIDLHTDRGEININRSQVERDIDLNFTNQAGSRTTTIRNGGATPVVVRKVILNNQPSNPACAFEVGQTVAPNSDLTVSTDTCGQITAVRAETDQGEVGVRTLRNDNSNTGNAAF